MNFDKEIMRKIRGLILFTIFVLVILWNYKILFAGVRFLGKVLFPFALGGAIAFVINIPMSFIEQKIFGEQKEKKRKWGQKMARPTSFLLTLVFVIGLLMVAIWGIVPELGKSIMNLGKTLQEVVPQVQSWASKVFRNNSELANFISSLEFEWSVIFEQFFSFLKRGAGEIVGTTFETAKNIVSGIATFVIASVFSCYVLLQKERLSMQVRKMMYAFMPSDWAEIFDALGSMTHQTFSNFLMGQCLEALILGGMFLISMSIFRLPYALLISVLITLTSLVPIFGAFVGCGIGVLLIFIVNPAKVILFLILFLVLQQIEGNFIYPYVVGNSVGLPSIWVLAAVSIGASLMGIVGMIIFIPIVSVIYTVLRGIVNRRLKEKGIEIEVRGVSK